MIVGIDQSKRSTAAVAIDSVGTLRDFIIIAPPIGVDSEELIRYQWTFINEFLSAKPVSAVAIEGLSFNSIGTGKDLLAGLAWYFRTRLSVEYPKIPVGVIPVLSWRSKVITPEERKAIAALRAKDAIKRLTVEKLPFGVKASFEEYIRVNKFKKESLYDLTDAYFIAQYRLSLES